MEPKKSPVAEAAIGALHLNNTLPADDDAVNTILEETYLFLFSVKSGFFESSRKFINPMNKIIHSALYEIKRLTGHKDVSATSLIHYLDKNGLLEFAGGKENVMRIIGGIV